MKRLSPVRVLQHGSSLLTGPDVDKLQEEFAQKVVQIAVQLETGRPAH